MKHDTGVPISALGVHEDQLFVGGSDGVIGWYHGDESEALDLLGQIPLDIEVAMLPGSTCTFRVLLVTDCTRRAPD